MCLKVFSELKLEISTKFLLWQQFFYYLITPDCHLKMILQQDSYIAERCKSLRGYTHDAPIDWQEIGIGQISLDRL